MTTDDHSNGINHGYGDDLTCIMCNEVFVLQEGEQNFYIQRGLDVPKRCHTCRAERKTQVDRGVPKEITQSVSSPIVETHEVECHHCGRQTVVPFAPRQGSSVYCRVCWEGIRNVGVSGAVYV